MSANFKFTKEIIQNNELTIYGNFPGFNKTNLEVYVDSENTLVVLSKRRDFEYNYKLDITGYEVKKVSIVDGVLSVVLTKYAPDKNRVKIDITD